MDFTKGIPKLNASIPYDSLQLTSIEGYFLSRIDGFSSVEDIASLSGLPYEQAIEVIKSLWDKKIFALDGVERDNEGAGYTALELNEDER
ncbi:MAG: hypothetical protein M1517_04805, partial [Deltaproteobacteria bacterium]|nr:hypothetical protein [Deltaproteobacteria bacterium]